MPEPIVIDRTREFVPFHSKRTLDEVYMPVKDLDDGLAVYVMKDRTLGTIGTQGVRLHDGSPGLIIHVYVEIAADGSAQIYPSTLVEKPFHSLDLTPVGADQLLALLIGALREAGLITQSTSPSSDD